ncbi:MAG: hypothetical protein J3T61_08275, partial [Candidatus Brocadiales bacterium]|nr:hypothetical protein [Candidatus Bathyanammoxibius sp.]
MTLFFDNGVWYIRDDATGGIFTVESLAPLDPFNQALWEYLQSVQVPPGATPDEIGRIADQAVNTATLSTDGGIPKPEWWDESFFGEWPPMTEEGFESLPGGGTRTVAPQVDSARIKAALSIAKSLNLPGAVEPGASEAPNNLNREIDRLIIAGDIEGAKRLIEQRDLLFPDTPPTERQPSLQQEIDRLIIADDVAGAQALIRRQEQVFPQEQDAAPRLTFDQAIMEAALAGNIDRAFELREIQKSLFESPEGTGITAIQAAQLVMDLPASIEEKRAWIDALTGAGNVQEQIRFISQDRPTVPEGARAGVTPEFGPIPPELASIFPAEVIALLQAGRGEQVTDTASLSPDVQAKVVALQSARQTLGPGASATDVLSQAGLGPEGAAGTQPVRSTAERLATERARDEEFSASGGGPAETVVPPIRGESQKAIDVPLEGLSRATSLQRVPTITAQTQAERLAAERDRDEAFSAGQGVERSRVPPIVVREQGEIVDEEERVPLIRGTPEQIARVEERRREIQAKREENNVPSITSSRFGRLDPETREPIDFRTGKSLTREEAERLQRERRTRRRVPTIT